MEESRQHPAQVSPAVLGSRTSSSAREAFAHATNNFSAPRTGRTGVQERPAAEDILRVAEEKDVDLIVMATHGRSGVRRFGARSVTEKVVRASACSSLRVRVNEG